MGPWTFGHVGMTQRVHKWALGNIATLANWLETERINMAHQVSFLIVGAGDRGQRYADLAARDPRVRIAAVADPDEGRRIALAERHDVPPARRYSDWREVIEQPRIANAAVIATLDRLHYEPALALAEQGYHLLLEKPMAVTLDMCHAIVDAARAAQVTLAVCHVLRYTPYTRLLRQVLDSGVIGQIVSVQHLEPVGWWHQAHSFVRGNWRRTDESTFMLMAKSVHDIDWLNHLVGRSARRVSSFGGLYHFRPEQRPAAAGERCIDCAIEPDCPYSAKRIYLGCLGNPAAERWPLQAVTSARAEEGVLDALRTGPYGRCVYRCDNDVVDHQVVNLEYEGGTTASFTMTAFTDFAFRQTKIFGTHGCLDGNGRGVEVLNFRTGKRERHLIESSDGQDPHAGGDTGLVHAFIEALLSGRPEDHLTSPEESLTSHLVTWAAEEARLTSTVVHLT
ncbi:MAG TPA: Gfo/Idh/MocA family oxidoreductase [Propionibacteriaceae bacterium]|nr:Gfo/Idh/MocA family oxidoreductase [Propionibacteriaceae bacterium]